MNLSKEEANRRLEEALNRIDELECELNDKDFDIDELQQENDSLQDELSLTKTDSQVIEDLLKQMRKDCVPYLTEFEEYIQNYFKFYVKE